MSIAIHKLKTLLTFSILSIFTIFGININTVLAQSLTSFYDSVIYLGDNELPRDELPPFEPQNYCDPSIYVENPQLEILELRDDYIMFKCSEHNIHGGYSYNSYTASFTLLISSKPKIQGCTNPNSLNYNSEATEDDGSCIAKIEGCTDSLATNYNPQANVHDERSCIYPIVEKPYEQKDITGYIENTQVQSGATTFNLALNLNTTGAILDISKIQIWNQFTPINSVTQDNKIIITLQKFNGQRLDVECTSYELTIPKNSITKNIEITENNQTKQIIEKNSNPITGNFSVVGCNENNNQNQQDQDTQNNDEENQNTEMKNQSKSTIKENGFYISIFDTDENGKQYINLANTIYLLGFIIFFLFLFFLLFSFLKNSFLGAKRR